MPSPRAAAFPWGCWLASLGALNACKSSAMQPCGLVGCHLVGSWVFIPGIGPSCLWGRSRGVASASTLSMGFSGCRCLEIFPPHLGQPAMLTLAADATPLSGFLPPFCLCLRVQTGVVGGCSSSALESNHNDP